MRAFAPRSQSEGMHACMAAAAAARARNASIAAAAAGAAGAVVGSAASTAVSTAAASTVNRRGSVESLRGLATPEKVAAAQADAASAAVDTSKCRWHAAMEMQCGARPGAMAVGVESAAGGPRCPERSLAAHAAALALCAPTRLGRRCSMSTVPRHAAAAAAAAVRAMAVVEQAAAAEGGKATGDAAGTPTGTNAATGSEKALGEGGGPAYGSLVVVAPAGLADAVVWRVCARGKAGGDLDDLDGDLDDLGGDLDDLGGDLDDLDPLEHAAEPAEPGAGCGGLWPMDR